MRVLRRRDPPSAVASPTAARSVTTGAGNGSTSIRAEVRQRRGRERLDGRAGEPCHSADDGGVRGGRAQASGECRSFMAVQVVTARTIARRMADGGRRIRSSGSCARPRSPRAHVALAFHAWPTGHCLQRTFLSMMVHELGHAVTAWWCGFGALPGLWKTLIPETRGVVWCWSRRRSAGSPCRGGAPADGLAVAASRSAAGQFAAEPDVGATRRRRSRSAATPARWCSGRC